MSKRSSNSPPDRLETSPQICHIFHRKTLPVLLWFLLVLGCTAPYAGADAVLDVVNTGALQDL